MTFTVTKYSYSVTRVNNSYCQYHQNAIAESTFFLLLLTVLHAEKSAETEIAEHPPLFS